MTGETENKPCRTCLLEDHSEDQCLAIRNFRLMLYWNYRIEGKVLNHISIIAEAEKTKEIYSFAIFDKDNGGIPGDTLSIPRKCAVGILQYAHSLGRIKQTRELASYEGYDYICAFLRDRFDSYEIESLFKKYGLGVITFKEE